MALTSAGVIATDPIGSAAALLRPLGPRLLIPAI
jgi:hypothetical protein